ncbi:MAG: DUF1080 domain-containing protein [Bernardetiaceae bacterium]|jgi:hypothetical protein|nr:DUF1080 domain-containing protein [Bernardetiaceae bacterium]
MKTFSMMALALGLAACAGSSQTETPADPTAAQTPTDPVAAPLTFNTLTEAEKQEGWQLLFDGTSLDQWRGAYLDSLPAKGWRVENGEIIVQEAGGGESTFGGDLVTKAQYAEFELKFEFMLTDSANSGVKYFVVEHQPKPAGSAFGLEFQVLDDAKHPDAKKGRDGNRTVGSLYDLMTAQGKTVNPIGQWNQGHIIVKGKQVEHWLNGAKVVAFERGSEAFRTLVAQSKYAAPEYNKNGRFGEAEKGHLLLQDHGDEVHYRNLKIKGQPLP